MTETYEGWFALVITMPSGVADESDELEVASAILFELGAAGIETKTEDPVKLIASFPPGVDPEELEGDVRESFDANAVPLAAIAFERYAPIDWAEHWKIHFRAIAFGPLWIVPTWIEPPRDAKHILRIDPSSAFGTGLHATTAMCLEQIVAISPITSILDVGTGTGILALAALELGAKRAVATDNDPEALRVAQENAERNRYADRLTISGDDPGALGERFDVVVANILARPLIELASEIAKALEPGGRLILSGITRSQVEDVVRAYEEVGIAHAKVETREEWACVIFGP